MDQQNAIIDATNQPEPSQSQFKLIHIVKFFERHWDKNGKFKLIITALGIFVSFMSSAILKEKIMRGHYCNDTGICERFDCYLSVVAAQYIFAFIACKGVDVVKPEKEDTTHFMYYIVTAAINSVEMVSSNWALKWITYPMQMIFKSAKPISVMISGLLICKRYPIQRYAFVLIIVLGLFMFNYFEFDGSKKPAQVKQIDEDTTNYQQYGIALLIFSLAMDGLLGAIRDKMRAIHAPTARQFMAGTNGYSALLLIIAIAITGETKEFIPFGARHPEVLWHIGVFAGVCAIGQFFIFIMIASYGSLACSITTTVRKFFSILFSIVFFGNPSTPLQWVGTVLVFAGLFADAFFGKEKHKSNNSEIEI